MKPLIAVNTRLLLRNRLDGIGWFTYHSLRLITRSHPEYRFLFVFDRKFDEQFIFSDNIIPVVAGPQARHPFLFYWWFEKTIPAVLKKYGADLFLSPDGFLSLKTPVPSLPVIHDLNFHHSPENLPTLVAWYYNRFFPAFAARAERIATVSEYSASDISKTYGIDPSKIDVVYNGASEVFTPATKAEKAELRNRITGGKPYFLMVGTIHPRKNLLNQLIAFEEFSHNSETAYQLLVVGDNYFWTNAMKDYLKQMKYRERVIFTGRLENTSLRDVYAAAEALLYVSFYEGFGIPIIEAFATRTPVITAPLTSMPEIAGEGALYAHPHSPSSISAAMKLLTTDVEKRSELIEKAASIKANFTWQRTADLLWQSVEKVIHAQEISSQGNN